MTILERKDSLVTPTVPLPARPETKERLLMPGQDPFVKYDHQNDLFHLPEQPIEDFGNVITRRSSKTLDGLFNTRKKPLLIMSNLSPEGMNRVIALLWAPEIEFDQSTDEWYMRLTASSTEVKESVSFEKHPNRYHRMFVARAKSALEPFEEIGRMYDSENDFWAIDPTPFHHKGQGYVTYSGWEGKPEDVDRKHHINGNCDLRQHLWIARMKNPWTIESGTARIIASPELDTEHGINEGPQVIPGTSNIIYSAGQSWQPNYHQRVLRFLGGDPLDTNNWRKHPEMVFGRPNIGHVSFVEDRDGKLVMFSHYKSSNNEGWKDRRIRYDEVEIRDGIPVLLTDKKTNGAINTGTEQ